MRDPKRIKRILKLIEEMWMTVPDQRFGQFLENYITGYRKGVESVFRVEDDKWEKGLREYVKKWKKERSVVEMVKHKGKKKDKKETGKKQ